MNSALAHISPLGEYLSELIAGVIQRDSDSRIAKALSRERHWAAYVRDVITPHERRLHRKMLRLLRELGKEVVGDLPEIFDQAWELRQRKVVPIRKAAEDDLWVFDKEKWEERFGEAFHDWSAGAVIQGGMYTAENQLGVVGTAFDVNNPRVVEFLRKREIKFKKALVGTTEKHIRGLIAQGMEAGEGIDDLTERIEQYFTGDSIRNRAEIIARTESTWAANAGTHEMYVQSGVVEGKEWLVAGDERLCEFCAAMGRKFNAESAASLDQVFVPNGGTVEGVNGGTYTVDYEDVSWPPLHPNCRCTIVPKLIPVDKLIDPAEVAQQMDPPSRKVITEADLEYLAPTDTGHVPWERLIAHLEAKGHKRQSITKLLKMVDQIVEGYSFESKTFVDVDSAKAAITSLQDWWAKPETVMGKLVRDYSEAQEYCAKVGAAKRKEKWQVMLERLEEVNPDTVIVHDPYGGPRIRDDMKPLVDELLGEGTSQLSGMEYEMQWASASGDLKKKMYEVDLLRYDPPDESAVYHNLLITSANVGSKVPVLDESGEWSLKYIAFKKQDQLDVLLDDYAMVSTWGQGGQRKVLLIRRELEEAPKPPAPKPPAPKPEPIAEPPIPEPKPVAPKPEPRVEPSVSESVPIPQAPVLPEGAVVTATEANVYGTRFPELDELDRLEVHEALGGSTGARLYVDPVTGEKYVGKYGASAEHIIEECYADAMYKAMGVRVPDFKLYNTGEGPFKLAKYIEDGRLLSQMEPAEQVAIRGQLHEAFHMDAFLANWDVTGLSGDNVLVDRAGQLWRIDNGGALRFRGMGGKKGKAFGDHVIELWSMRRKGNLFPFENPAQFFFFNAPYETIMEGVGQLLENKERVLGVVSDTKLRKVLDKRIVNLESYHQIYTDMFKRDVFKIEYVDDFTELVCGLRYYDVLSAYPSKLVIDYRNEIWGHYDTGASGALADFPGGRIRNRENVEKFQRFLGRAVNGNPEEYRGPAEFLGLMYDAQRGSSSSEISMKVKMFLGDQTRLTDAEKASKWFLDEWGNWIDSWEDAKQTYGALSSMEELSFMAEHALTYETLRVVNLPNTNRASRLVRVLRTDYAPALEDDPIAISGTHIRRAQRRAVFSSTSSIHKVSVGGDPRVVMVADVPFHRVLFTYLRGGLMDTENEFVCMLTDVQYSPVGGMSGIAKRHAFDENGVLRPGLRRAGDLGKLSPYSVDPEEVFGGGGGLNW